jgi:Domain of unknown function (DUF4288)
MWYGANLLFESSVPDENGRLLQEESIRLIDANDESEAIAKAVALGNSEEHEYGNPSGQTVRWRFVSVLEIQDLCEASLYDGMEVFSQMKWNNQRHVPT